MESKRGRVLMSPVRDPGYSIRFEIPWVPELPNVLRRKHWRKQHRHLRTWRVLVKYAVGRRRPIAPLLKARVIIEFWRKREPDPDNLVASAKPILDALQPPRDNGWGVPTVGASIITDDRSENFEGGRAEVIYHKCARGEKPHCVVTVTEVA